MSTIEKRNEEVQLQTELIRELQEKVIEMIKDWKGRTNKKWENVWPKTYIAEKLWVHGSIVTKILKWHPFRIKTLEDYLNKLK